MNIGKYLFFLKFSIWSKIGLGLLLIVPNTALSKQKRAPQSANSFRVELNRLSSAKKWKQVINKAAPRYKKLRQNQIITLIKAYHNNYQAKDALIVIKYHDSKWKPSFRSYYYKGLCYSQLAGTKNKQERKRFLTMAAKSFQKSIKAKPNYEDAYNAWIESLENHTSNFEDEVLDIYRLHDQNNESKNSHLPHKCELNYARGYMEQAIKLCDRAIDTYPKEDTSYLFRALIDEEQGNMTAASNRYAAIASKFPKSHLAQSSVAEYYFNLENWTKSAIHFRKAIHLNTMSLTANLGLAKSLTQLKKYKDALPSFAMSCFVSKRVDKSFKFVLGRIRKNRKLYRAYEFYMTNCRTHTPGKLKKMLN